jgi:hypothetical protein
MSHPRTTPPLPRWLLPSLLLLAPAALGLATGTVGERTAVGAFVMWAEPFLLAVGAWGVLALLAERKLPSSLALLLGLLIAVFALRHPPVPIPVAEADLEAGARLRTCADLMTRVRRPVRMITWTLEPGPRQSIDTAALLDQAPDIIVINGLQDIEVADRIARALKGEAKLLTSSDSDDTVALIARGAFQHCEGREDSWVVSLPAESGRDARAVLSFPDITDVGVVPLVTVRLSGAGAPSEWRAWPDRLVDGARKTASVAATIGARRMVVLGDFAAPPTFRRVAGTMLGADLSEIAVPPSWPAHVGPMPTLPLHALDRVWVGSNWAGGTARVLPPGAASRAPVLIELEPL